FAEIVAPDHIDIAREMLRRRSPGASTAPVYTMDVLAREGRRVLLEVSARDLVEGGRPVGIQGIARDITERMSLEAQLRQSQKMEAIGTLAGGVAHDFNNLLTTILGYSDLVLDQIARDSPLREDVQEIRKSAERAASLTRQLLAFSRRQLIEPAIVDLNAIVGDMDKMLRRLIGEDLELSTVMRPDLGRARVDPGQIEQVIMNLVVNARDAMPAGGRLTIETNNVDLDEEYAHTHIPTVPGPYVMLAVTDTGEGMDAETRSRIFEPFFTTKPTGKGTGLGLSTVYGIVKQSGGFIWVYSEPGHGTSFKIYFPRAEEEAGSERASSLKPRNHEETKGSETLLVVEDEEGVRKFARIVLQRAGYHVLEAKDGTEAVAVAERFEGEIHLLLTDSVMPGLTVRDLIARFGTLRPEAALLLMSGYTDEAIARSGLIHAGIPFVQKPFSAQDLAGRVRDVLDARRR
ncbi:MAG TPA: ATP-binding protein, partial [Thermoanaerobaculia bacterium]|nr:ATP-binding protein [Thermoanaerobaculia bacterium]